MNIKIKLTVLLACLLNFSSLFANTINVNCDSSPPGALSSALATAAPGDTIIVNGLCHESAIIDKEGISLIGNAGTEPATITGFFPQDRITIDGVTRVHIEGIVIKNGINGILGIGNASFTLSDVTVSANIIGINADQGSNIVAEGSVNVTDNQVFGLEVINGSKFSLQDNAMLEISGSIVGTQISVNSSFFAGRGSTIDVNNNSSIGFSVNSGSAGFLFNATLRTHNNGADGLDVVSASNFDIDSDAQLISENNGREGISIDNSIMNLFGFFSSQPGLPRITASNNVRNGVLVENTSKLDIGENSSIVALNNGAAGVSLDDGSSAVLQRSEIQNNNGQLPDAGGKDERATGPADVVASFGSRITFKQSTDSGGGISPNNIGMALCDHTSISRGDVQCKSKRD